MKRCPECYEIYDEGEKFCELDGQRLMPDPALSIADEESALADPEGLRLNRESWLIGLGGVIAGIILCAGVYALYTLGSIESDSKNQKTPVSASRMQDQPHPMRPAPAPIRELTPEPTETLSPDTEPESSAESSAPSTTRPESQTVAARLNQGPVSTGLRKKESDDSDDSTGVQTIIQMNDGSTMEVDAAWEDGQGVWYRRGGMVAFVDSQRVKAIIGRAAPKPPSSQ